MWAIPRARREREFRIYGDLRREVERGPVFRGGAMAGTKVERVVGVDAVSYRGKVTFFR